MRVKIYCLTELKSSLIAKWLPDAERNLDRGTCRNDPQIQCPTSATLPET